MLWLQYKKELKAHRGDTALIVGALLVWYIFLTTRIGKWPTDLIVVLGLLPTGFLPLWILWTSLQLYRQEWRENTHYLMLSLPIPAWKITVPKMAAMMTGVVLYSVLLVFAGWWILDQTGAIRQVFDEFRTLDIPMGRIIGSGLKVYGLTLLSFILMGLITQLAFVISRLFTRFQGIVIAWVWLVEVWWLGRLTEWIGPWLDWLPSLKLKGISVINGQVELTTLILPSGGIWASVLVGIGVFALLNLTLSKAVEVS